MGAAHVHVHQDLFLAPAEETPLSEHGDAGEAVVPDAEPALRRCLAVPGSQRSVVGGHRGEVLGVDVGRGVDRAQRCVSSLR